MARKIESERRNAGGLEGLLDSAAIVLLAVGIIGTVASLVWLKLYGILPALSILINTILVWLLLRSIAEIIRLLKKQAGLPYAGDISYPDATVAYTCSECGAMLHSESRCDSCGANIETD
ncbi:hypothetical protein [Mariniblastus fucicola]|uniref:Zinc-ribbon domain-containing protein n=1 Tax=Mariniblastus fucicola TaxID=980251 RepID=A0A5B9PET1_9BACT|nr:hypothetical protein [Mariniblastus fucicola]QEG21491.1 hypothetical protein MFFC18_13470 [Mariniblastus fucicola]